MKKLFVLFAMLLAVSCGGKDGGGDSKTVELTLAHTFNDAHPVSEAYNKFARRIHEETDGAYKVNVYGNGQLGEQRANMELVQSGTLDMASVYVGNLENVQDTYEVITAPYMFVTTDQYREALNSDVFRDKIYQATLDKGFIGLVPMDAGTRNFYNTVRAINKPSDLNGVKFRISESPTAVEMTERLGGIPVVMPAGETYTSIQQNLIHGGENNATYLVSSRQAEVVKYYSFTEHTRIPDILIMSAASWNKIPNEYKEIFLAVAKEISTEFVSTWETSEAAFLEEAKKIGVQVNYIDDLEPFRVLVAPMHEALVKKSAAHKELVEYIRSIDG